MGDGKGNFANQITTSLGASRPLSIAVGDFNEDNQLDIAVANYGIFNITLLLGSNNGSFRVEATYDMGYDSIPYSLIVADFNNDKKMDIASVTYGTNNLAILLAKGNATFVSQKYSTGNGSHPCSVAFGDFNHDNALDVIVANSGTSSVGIFLRSGNGTFTNMIMHPTGLNSRPAFVAVSDLDNDTNLDIVVVDSGNNNLLVLIGNGYGNFTIILTHSTGYNSDPSSIAIDDFDNDNKPDIVITNNATNNIFVITAYDIYPVSNQKAYPTGQGSYPTAVAVGDFNNDNVSDVVVANSNTDNVGIFINLGNGTFQDQIKVSTENRSRPYPVAVGDVNNDDQLDIVVLMNSLNKIRILIGYGNGTFTYGDSYSTGNKSYPESIAVGDLNNDTNLDIVVANGDSRNVGVLLGYGNGSFTNIVPHPIEIKLFPTSIVLNDINNDHTLDIITADFNNVGIAVFLGYGNGSFSDPLIIPTKDDTPGNLAVGDLNNDDRLDIVYVSPLQGNVGILFGYGNGTFGKLIQYPSEHGSWPYSVTLGYFNNDTIMDIAVTKAYDYNIGIFFGLGNGSFTVPKTLSTGYNSLPISITCSDFNNDHQLDIVVTNNYTYNIGVFLIHYEEDFASETNYVTGSGPHPYSVAIGDLNQDNQSDIVVANSGNDDIQLLVGYNEGIFMNKVTYSTGFGSYPQFVSVADLNRDNQLDIVVANNRNDTINVLLRSNNGTFDLPMIYPTGFNSFPSSIAVGDFNEDNWTDIIVANDGTSDIAIFLGFDYATFTNDSIFISGSSPVPAYVAVGDFNNDHQCDIIVANSHINSVGVYLGYGNGSFAEQMSFPTGTTPYSVAVGDFDSDTQLDIVVTNRDGDSVSVLLGYGNGSFTAQTLYNLSDSSHPLSVAVGDLNRDNILDIVVANYLSNSIGIFIGYGDGTFTNQASYFLLNVSTPSWVVVDDINNDNILDVVVANYGQGSIGLFFGHGNGSFRDVITLSTGNNSRPRSVATGDINNDKWIDIAVINQNTHNVGIFFGNGDGTFSLQKTYSTGSQSSARTITIADLNNDASLDIIFSDSASGNGNVGVFYGYGDGNFAVLKTYSTGFNSDPSSIAICDFNNDSQLDLAVSYLNKDSIGIKLREKSEPFATPSILSSGNDSRPKSVSVGDFNNDNHLDITVANSGTNTIGIFLGNGNGTFAQQQTYSTGNYSSPVSLAVGDFNNDTHLDVVVANSQSSTIGIFLGYGNGHVAVLTSYSTGISSTPSSIAVKDLNKDNHLDIIVANFDSNEVLVFLGFGNGTFFEPKSYSLGYNARPQSVAIGDINNDSLFDIVIANYGTDYVEVLLQTC